MILWAAAGSGQLVQVRSETIVPSKTDQLRSILYGPFAPDNLCATIPFHGVCHQWDGDCFLSGFSVGSWPPSTTTVFPGLPP